MQAEDDARGRRLQGFAAGEGRQRHDHQLGYLKFYAGDSKGAVDAIGRAIGKGGLRQEGEAYLLRGDAENDLARPPRRARDWQQGRRLSEREGDGRTASQGA